MCRVLKPMLGECLSPDGSWTLQYISMPKSPLTEIAPAGAVITVNAQGGVVERDGIQIVTGDI